MPYITARDGTQIHFKDWGSGRPGVCAHGWPRAADAGDAQMMFRGTRGYRVIAHDRRGHGRSSQPWFGNDMDTYADDLADLIQILDLRDAVLVGHSTGGGEVARYVGRYGTERVGKVVLLGSVTPLMLKTDENPRGTPIEAFDEIRDAVLRDRSQFFSDLARPFYGANRKGAKVSKGLRRSFWHQGMQCGIKSAYDCVAQFSETDFGEDLARIDVPTLVAHGDDDQIVPIKASALRTAKLVSKSVLKVYKKGSHGLAQVQPDAFNLDLLKFIES